MNYQWNYLLGPISNLEDVLPLKFKEKIYLNTQLRLVQIQETNKDSTELFVSIEKLFFFLNEGFFRILDKKENYTIIEFYEPVGNVVCLKGEIVDTIATSGVKVYINDYLEVLMEPIIIPRELW
jgi:hypothetical protein